MSPLEYAIAIECFARSDPELGENWYELSIVALDEGAAAGDPRFRVSEDAGLIAQAGTIIAPGWIPMDSPVPEELVDLVRTAHGRGARIVSLCNGILVLAAAGLLKGRKAALHWKSSQALAGMYPDIDIQPNLLYVDHGDVLTSAGGAAGIDLCLHIIRKDFGTRAANTVARHLVAPPHRDGGQAQYIRHHVPAIDYGTKLGLLLDQMRSDLTKTYSIAEMAGIANMSRSTFLRRFNRITGMPPAQWLTSERLAKAVDYLENTVLSVDEIALRIGFASASSLRAHFKKLYSVSPVAYRKLFRSQG